jgi:hypothetical protein
MFFGLYLLKDFRRERPFEVTHIANENYNAPGVNFAENLLQ